MYMLWIIYKYCVFQSGSNGPADTFNNKNIDGNDSLNVTVDIIVAMVRLRFRRFYIIYYKLKVFILYHAVLFV